MEKILIHGYSNLLPFLLCIIPSMQWVLLSAGNFMMSNITSNNNNSFWLLFFVGCYANIFVFTENINNVISFICIILTFIDMRVHIEISAFQENFEVTVAPQKKNRCKMLTICSLLLIEISLSEHSYMPSYM